MATAAKTKKMVKKVRKRIKTKRKPRANDVDPYCNFVDGLDPYMLAGVENDSVKEWILSAGEK